MAALRGPPPKVIWLRRGNQPISAVEDMIRRSADAISAFAGDPHDKGGRCRFAPGSLESSQSIDIRRDRGWYPLSLFSSNPKSPA